MTHSKSTEEAVSQNNKSTMLPELPVSLSLKFPSSVRVSNCMRVLYIYAPPSLPLPRFVSSWCSELYLVPARHRRCPPAGQGATGLNGEEPSSSLIQAGSSNAATQLNKAAKQRDRRRQAGHAMVLCHGHTHANTHDAKQTEQQGIYNYASDIRLMMTFPQM